MAMAHAHGNSTHSNLRLRDAHDAHVLFQAVRQGHLQLIRKRLTAPEQQALRAGQVFVWADREGSLERWTDGHNWSPSRVRGPFLMYDEMPEDTEAFLRRKQLQKSGERRVKQPRKKRLPPLPGGLSKQTYSATLIQQGIDIQKWHVTAYFQEDCGADNLPTIDDDELLRTIIVPDNTFKSSMTRKSKGSVSRRRDSMSNNDRPILDDGESDTVASPIEEYPPSPPVDSGFSSPHTDDRDERSSAAANCFPGAQPLPWESATPTMQSSGPLSDRRGRGRADSGNGSGSSAGSTGTLQGDRSPPFNPPSASASLHRGRPMHLEGIHAMYDNPRLTFSALSPTHEMRHSSMPVPDWRTSHMADSTMNEDRRGSLMSIGSSRSASSTSTSHSTNTSSRIHPSSESSPASSWSQQSPFLNPAMSSASSSSSPGVWNVQQQRVKVEHMNSPLAQTPLYPISAPTSSYHDTMSSLPAHLQHHPEAVPSAVPPPYSVPSRKPTLPFSLSAETVTYGPHPPPTAQSPLQQIPQSQAHFTPSNSYAAYGGTRDFGFVASTNDTKIFNRHPNSAPLEQTQQLQYTQGSPSPGIWENSPQPQRPAGDFSLPYPNSRYPSQPTQAFSAPIAMSQASGGYAASQGQFSAQYTIPAPGEVFESIVSQPQGSGPGTAYPQHQQSWP